MFPTDAVGTAKFPQRSLEEQQNDHHLSWVGRNMNSAAKYKKVYIELRDSVF